MIQHVQLVLCKKRTPPPLRALFRNQRFCLPMMSFYVYSKFFQRDILLSDFFAPIVAVVSSSFLYIYSSPSRRNNLSLFIYYIFRPLSPAFHLTHLFFCTDDRDNRVVVSRTKAVRWLWPRLSIHPAVDRHTLSSFFLQ